MFIAFQQRPSQRWGILVSAAAFFALTAATAGHIDAKSKPSGSSKYELSPIELLGKHIFFDNISIPPRQSCSTCHQPWAGWTGGQSQVNLHQVAMTGAHPRRVGTLKPPSNGYASFIGEFQPCVLGVAGYCGGNFWNGRSEGLGPVFAGATEHIGSEIFYSASEEWVPELYAQYGRYLGPVADQALNPFTNPVEQNISRLGVCWFVLLAKYSKLFEIVWGEPVDVSSDYRVDISYKRIAVSLAAYQSSAEVNSFSSKRDIALQRELDGIDVDDTPGAFPLVGLTAQENYGHALFYGITTTLNPLGKNARCSACHADNPTPPPLPPGAPGPPGGFPPSDTGNEPLQTYADDAYHNIGVPLNPEIPGDPGPDAGLENHTGETGHRGLHKTPTLRNVDKRPWRGFVKAYTHNGWFKSLESIVHFYNTAFVGGATANAFGVTRCPEGIKTEQEALLCNCWPAPEQPGTPFVPPGPGGPPPGPPSGPPAPGWPFLFGDLGLTAEDEAAIVAYLKALTDAYTPKPPKPYK
jgi:cytochrome c peroxidase